MTTDYDEFGRKLVAAVQAELDRHASAVIAEIDRLREDGRRERDEIRSTLGDQIEQLSLSVARLDERINDVAAEARLSLDEKVTAVDARRSEEIAALGTSVGERMDSVESQIERRSEEVVSTVVGDHVDSLTAAVDERMTAVERRLDQRFDEIGDSVRLRFEAAESGQQERFDSLSSSIEPRVEALLQPIVSGLRSENERLSGRVSALDTNLREFDRQAARLVTYVDQVNTQMEQRNAQLAESVRADVVERVAELRRLVDDNDSAIRVVTSDITEQFTGRMAGVEDRLAEQVVALENRVNDETARKIADIDRQVARVGHRVDESFETVDERIAAVDDRFVKLDRAVAAVEHAVDGIDQDALEEMKERLSTAAGEAMLVRIEMERLEKAVNERSDQLAVRLTDVETGLQDASLDVSTAVQLDRLELVERSLAELDPDQFVRKDGRDAPESATAPPSPIDDPSAPAGSSSSVDVFTMADSSGRSSDTGDGTSVPDGVDVGAIIASAEPSAADSEN